jgi:hypothetical protein
MAVALTVAVTASRKISDYGHGHGHGKKVVAAVLTCVSKRSRRQKVSPTGSAPEVRLVNG